MPFHTGMVSIFLHQRKHFHKNGCGQYEKRGKTLTKILLVRRNYRVTFIFFGFWIYTQDLNQKIKFFIWILYCLKRKVDWKHIRIILKVKNNSFLLIKWLFLTILLKQKIWSKFQIWLLNNVLGGIPTEHNTFGEA